jgi:hypothetical protein
MLERESRNIINISIQGGLALLIQHLRRRRLLLLIKLMYACEQGGQ